MLVQTKGRIPFNRTKAHLVYIPKRDKDGHENVDTNASYSIETSKLLHVAISFT